ncbi:MULTISPECIES: hypothetical protein [unclassified Sphingomonas]|uniref:hypothetical protein n=1 Tax=unclassified Sphingomonas TaxID=196159 RepID=UPI0022B53F47|nr:hypothetical protein [Sphingomonas sp. NIBR02145]WHU03727.1 hypothetical protein O3305_03755 [Sphingomonas sp. NIBR02145]
MPGLPKLHSDLLAALDELEHLLAQPTLDQLRLSRVRLYISKVNGERRTTVDRLCEALEREATGVHAQQIAALRQSNIEKRIEYTVHVGNWGLREVAADWPGYCRASVELSRSIRQQVMVEQALLCDRQDDADPLALSDPRGYMGRQLPNQDIGAPHGHPPRPHLR